MKKIILIGLCVLMVVALVACSGGSTNPVVGKWENTTMKEVMKELLGEDAGNDEYKEMWEFKEDGSYEQDSNGKKITGTYTIDGDQVTIKDDKTGETMVVTLNGDTMEYEGIKAFEKQ